MAKKKTYLDKLASKIYNNLNLRLGEKKKLGAVRFFGGKVLRIKFYDREYGVIKTSIYFSIENENEFTFISIINDPWHARVKGYHRIALENIIKTVKKDNKVSKKLKKIKVVFVRRNMENFWFGNGFVRSNNNNSIREFYLELS